MVLPGILSPCPVCGDSAEFCPVQNGSIRAGRKGRARRWSVPSDAGRTGETAPIRMGVDRGESGEKEETDGR